MIISLRDPSEWEALAKVLRLPGGLNPADQGANLTAIDAAISEQTSVKEAGPLVTALQDHGIAAARTFSYRDLLEDPHLAARNFWQWKDRAVVGLQPNPSAPYRFGDEPLPVETPAPTLGQHNAEVLGELLGLTPEDLKSLEANGIIGTRPKLK